VRRREGRRPLPPPVAWSITFVFVVTTWVFFRAASLPDAFAMLRAMAGFGHAAAAANALAVAAQGTIPAAFALVAGLVVVAMPRNSNSMTRELSASWLAGAATSAAFVAAILQFGHVAPFLYFNF